MVTIIILGMHRSATSMTSRALHLSKEVYMGYQFGNGWDNPKGHYEHIPIIGINDDILKAAGGDWANPPSRESILKQRPKFERRIKNALEDLYQKAQENNMPSCGFKDPRLCLTIELYLPYLINPQFIGTFRSPKDISKSLNKRNQISLEHGENLTKEYNKRIFDFLQTYVN
jgi:hypothetical protein